MIFINNWTRYVQRNNHMSKKKLGQMLITSAGLAVVATNSEDLLSTIYGIGRFLRSLKIGLLISLDYYCSMMGLNEKDTNYEFMMSRIHQRAANHILDACLKNGGPYIKIGQGLVSLGHILPVEYVSTLKILQDKCLTREDGEMDKLFLEDFNKRPREMFQEFNMKPIAAASLAQVYEATTYDGNKVAVKVQYIDLRKRFFSDTRTIKFLCKLVGFIHADFNFEWVIDEIRETLKDELDFLKEGANAEKCASDLSKFPYIYVPKIHWDLCSERVLVMEYIEGIKISEKDELKQRGFSLSDIDRKMFDAFGEQIFQAGFVHADPHPGNVIVRRRNKNVELVLLDHGLYQSLDSNERIALSHFWKSIVLNDHVGMQKYAELLGVKDYEMLAEILTQSPLKSRNFRLKFKLSDEDMRYIAEFARKRFDKIMRTLKDMPRSLILIVRNLNTIRAIARDHGDPIDRYTVLARAATKNAFQDDGTIIARLVGVQTKLYFELKLLSHMIKKWLRKRFLRALVLFGRAPDLTQLAASFQKSYV